MKEIDSYLRYTLPGMIFLLAMAIPLVIVDYSKVITFFELPISKSIVVIVALLASSGVFGFLSSSIFWCQFLLFDWLRVKRTLANLADHISVVDQRQKNIKVENLRLQEIWSVFNTYWYLSDPGETLESKANRLSDITSSLGTAFFSLFASIILWLLIVFCNNIEFQSSHLWVLLFWSFFLIVIGVNYYKTLKRFRLFINSVFSERIIRNGTVQIVLSG